MTVIVILILLFLAYKLITSRRVQEFMFTTAQRTTMRSQQVQGEVRQVQRSRITPEAGQYIDKTLRQYASGMWIPHWLPGVLQRHTQQRGVLPDFAAQTVQQHITALGLMVDSSYQRYALPPSLPENLRSDSMRLCLTDAAGLGVSRQEMEAFYLRSVPQASPEEARAEIQKVQLRA